MTIEALFSHGLLLSEALELLWPVLGIVLGIVAYGIFVFHFCRFVAARDMFRLNLPEREEGRRTAGNAIPRLAWWVVRFAVLYPAFAFFWLAVLTLVLGLLSEGRPLFNILLIAMALVSAIRVAAYYDEDLARDLSKMLPFAVLSFFIVSVDSLDGIGSLDIFREVIEHRKTIFHYLVFLVALEIVLRLVFLAFTLSFPPTRESSRNE